MDKEEKITRLRICNILELWAELQGEDLAAEEKFLAFVKTRLQAVDGVRSIPLTDHLLFVIARHSWFRLLV